MNIFLLAVGRLAAALYCTGSGLGSVLLFVEASRRWVPRRARPSGPERPRAWPLGARTSQVPRACRATCHRLPQSEFGLHSVRMSQWRCVVLLTVVFVIVWCFCIGTMVYSNENVEWFSGEFTQFYILKRCVWFNFDLCSIQFFFSSET